MKVNKISETLFEVEENYTVKFHKKPGREIITCNCKNHAKFCNEGALCSHKLKVIKYRENELANKLLDSLINEYSGFMNIKAKIDAEATFQELKKLKKLIN